MNPLQLEQALNLIEDAVSPITQSETTSLTGALGRILAQDILAPMWQPPFPRSPVDGYALRALDTANAENNKGIVFPVMEKRYAGDWSDRVLQSGEAFHIMTGAPIPNGADCVISQEDVVVNDGLITIFREMKPYENYCFRGEEIQQGDLLLNAGEKLDAICIGLLASIGVYEVPLRRKPKIGILSTGNELRSWGEPLPKGKIYDSNGMMLCSRLSELGYAPSFFRIMPDDPDKIAQMLCEWSLEADAIITTGGVSVGEKDIFHDVLPRMEAKRLFWGVGMKPGRPVIFALYQDVPLLCLPGNPFAALVTFELMARRLLYRLTGDGVFLTRRVSGIITEDFPKASKGRRFVRATWNDGKLVLPRSGHSSSILNTMRGCNCLIDIPAGTEALYKGDVVQVVLL